MKFLILIITAFISLQLSAGTTPESSFTLSQISEIEQPKLSACKRKCGCLCPAKPPPEKKVSKPKSPSYADIVLYYSKNKSFVGNFKIEGNPCSGSGDSKCKKQGCTGMIAPGLCGGCGPEDSIRPMVC